MGFRTVRSSLTSQEQTRVDSWLEACEKVNGVLDGSQVAQNIRNEEQLPDPELRRFLLERDPATPEDKIREEYDVACENYHGMGHQAPPVWANSFVKGNQDFLALKHSAGYVRDVSGLDTTPPDIRKYECAIVLKDDNPVYFRNYGNALFEVGRLTNDPALIEKATEYCLKAESLKEGSGAISLACMEALQGNREKAIEWLKKAVKYDASNRKIACEDEDMKSLWNDPEFKRITRDE